MRQQRARILLTLLPHAWVQVAKDLGPVGRPTPPIIPGEFFEWLESRGQFARAHDRFGFSFDFRIHIRSMSKSKAANAAIMKNQ